jgi:MATE family multidrug resistance protein
MILSNVTVPLLGIVDTAVMGHLEHPRYLAGVAIGATIFSFLFIGLNFLRMGTTGLAAQAYGAGDADEQRTVLVQALLVALAMALLLLVVQRLVGRVGLLLLGPEPDVVAPAWTYFTVRIWAAPAALANFALIGWFIGMQNTRLPLALMLTVNVTNIALSVLFVVGLGYRTGGVAAASVIAEYAGLALGLAQVRRLLPRDGRTDWARVRSATRLKRMLGVNANLLVRTLSLMFVFGFVTAQGARFGTAVLAANAILMQFQYLMAYALDGFAHAAEALAGRAQGAGDPAAFRRAVSLSLQWTIGVAAAFCAVYALAGTGIVALMTGQPELRRVAAEYLPWIIASPLVSAWSFLFDGVFVGATWAAAMRNTMLLSAFTVFLPFFYLTQWLELGNHGLWLAFIAFMAARGLSMGWIYRHRTRGSVM